MLHRVQCEQRYEGSCCVAQVKVLSDARNNGGVSRDGGEAFLACRESFYAPGA
jgi:hypothetical protein